MNRKENFEIAASEYASEQSDGCQFLYDNSKQDYLAGCEYSRKYFTEKLEELLRRIVYRGDFGYLFLDTEIKDIDGFIDFCKNEIEE